MSRAEFRHSTQIMLFLRCEPVEAYTKETFIQCGDCFGRSCLNTPENDSNEILTQVIGLTCSGQTGRIHRADFDVWGLAEER
jgi:hypothetical protein